MGFGSKRSTWEGPPYMNRKMTLVAFASKWGGLGDSGSGASAAVARGRNPSSASIEARARPAKPPPACQRNSRRVRPQKDMDSTPREIDRRDIEGIKAGNEKLFEISNLKSRILF